MSEELRVRKIKDGTVIDHISAGKALAVLKILGVKGNEDNVISVLINVPSARYGKKDIVKFERREVSTPETDKIALISPNVTINIIRDYKVVEKKPVKLPEKIEEAVKCLNPGCITNSREPVKNVFYVQRQNPTVLRCYYCGVFLEEADILKQF